MPVLSTVGGALAKKGWDYTEQTQVALHGPDSRKPMKYQRGGYKAMYEAIKAATFPDDSRYIEVFSGAWRMPIDRQRWRDAVTRRIANGDGWITEALYRKVKGAHPKARLRIPLGLWNAIKE